MALSRNLIQFSKLYNIHDVTKLSNSGNCKNIYSTIFVRTAKHYNPKFKWHRGKKVQPVILPHTKEYEEIRLNFIKQMKLFPRYWKSRPITITTANEILDPYKPPEGDGKVSDISSGVINKLTTKSKSKVTEMNALRKIKNYESLFQPSTFVQEAHDIYIQAHTVLMKNDSEELSKYVTEKANADMREGLKNTTLRWKFIESLEPPKLVQARVQEIFVQKNLFAQLTVRFHTKQCLAIYDRFGRLIYGSEILAKDVLEYVVFEKHLNNEYGVWRLHAKIIPEWKESSAGTKRTYVVKDNKEEDEDELSDYLNNYYEPESESKTTTEIVKGEAKT